MIAADAPAEHGRFPCFDGLRALAALAVLLHHASIATAYSLRGFEVPLSGGGRFGEYFAHMDAGVQVFFLISGFLLYRPFVAKNFADVYPGLGRFFRHRFLRIYPAYWVAFIGIALWVGIRMPIGGARSMTEYFFLVHLYDTTSVVTETGRPVWRALGGISQSWTLVVEVSFYLFLPLYAAIIRRVGAGRLRATRFRIEAAGLVVLVLISVLWRAVAYWVVADGSSFEFLGPYWLPANLDLFAMGMGLAVLRVWSDTRPEPSPLLERIGSFDWAWWLGAAVAFHVVTFGIGLSGRLELVYGGQAYLRQFLYGITALCLLVPAVFGPQRRGVVRRGLQLAPVVYLGVISYGIYLWHQAFITVIHDGGFQGGVVDATWADGWDANPLPNGPFLVHVLGAFVLTVIVASASWFFVERPILRRKDQPLFGRRSSEPADA